MSNRSLIGEGDMYLFNEGTHVRMYDKLGAHASPNGVSFAVWAPNACYVSVIGDFNGWNAGDNPLTPSNSGIWEGFVPKARVGTKYKFHISSKNGDYRVEKADPFGFSHEIAPATASIVTDLSYEWKDREWMARRAEKNDLSAPWSVYEVHLGSWRRVPEQGNRSLTYLELAEQLPAYAKEMGFTHVQFLPVMEHPFYGSWGYQTTGYFAPTGRQGSPVDFMRLIDALHEQGIGVVLDWVPSHFPADQHGLSFFDGTHLFEHEDPRQGFHPDWNSCIFNYSRNEVRSFLLSSAMFWLDKYHVDGLRVDAVASMLYLDYSRRPGQWIPNKFGGKENIDAIAFLRQLNSAMYKYKPDVQMIAEESTSWGGVSRPVDGGGLGFGMKWDMGWMHDTLEFMGLDSLFRQYHAGEFTFRMLYAFQENFMLPLSHDEVVYGKGSLLRKMPGDDWQKFANLRALYGYMFGQPGKKLLFMGAEFAQWEEWGHDRSLDWHLTQFPRHGGVKKWVSDLNGFYAVESALHNLDFSPAGFEWSRVDGDSSIFAFTRRAANTSDIILVVLNLTPVLRPNYRIGVRRAGKWVIRLDSDAPVYGGSGGAYQADPTAGEIPWDNHPYSISLTLPPLSALFLKSDGVPL